MIPSCATFLACALIPSAGPALAIAWQLTGSLAFQSSEGAPQPLLNLLGTPFDATLSYDHTASPSSVIPPSFANYADNGLISVGTSLGIAQAPLENLQTFINQGSNFNGFGDHVKLDGPLGSLGLSPVRIDFSFHRSPNSPLPGLTSLALPVHLAAADFETIFVRVTFAPMPGYSTPINLFAEVTSVSAIPEPSSLAVPAACALAVGIRRRVRARHPVRGT